MKALATILLLCAISAETRADEVRWEAVTARAGEPAGAPVRVQLPGAVEPSPEISLGGTLVSLPGTSSFDPTPGESSKDGYSIRIRGRIGYTRADGVFVGLDGAYVNAYDADNSPLGTIENTCGHVSIEHIGIGESGTTDSQGFFDFTEHWDPCWGCDETPDIFLKIVLSNNWVALFDDPDWDDIRIDYCTGVVDDYGGTDLNFGTLVPVHESSAGEMHLFNTLTRAARWSADRGWDPAYDFGYGSYQRLHVLLTSSYPVTEPLPPDEHDNSRWAIGVDDYWNEVAHAQVFARHLLDAYDGPVALDTCNGVCDGDGCTYCTWCRENEVVAVREGFVRWFGGWIAGLIPSTYGHPTYYSQNFDSLDDCGFLTASPEETVGNVAAFLWDLADSPSDNHPEYPEWRDSMSNFGDEVLDAYLQDHPRSVADLLSSLKTGVTTGTRNNVWETAANCGIDSDELAPGIATALVSDTHPVGSTTSDSTVEIRWIAAPDDCSGIAGYSYAFTTSPALPVADLMIESYPFFESPSLPPGTFYFCLRAVDRVGNWSSGYAVYGPFTIDDPTPADLAHPLQPGWSAPVVPRSSTGAVPGNVAVSPVLTGGADTYWNVAPSNLGSQPTGQDLGAWLYIDGRKVFNPFEPGTPGSALFPSLAGFATTHLLDEGPVQVGGGRHMFGALLDSGEQLVEPDELNNGWGRSWAWIPASPVAANQALGATSVPDYNGGWEWWGGGVLWPNSLGYRFVSSGRWNAFYAFADHEDSDFDVHLHDAATGSQDGFFDLVTHSNRGERFLDAVFVNRDLTGGVKPWDAAIVQGDYGEDPGAVGYGHVTSLSIPFGIDYSDQLDPGEPIHLREFDLPAGATGPVSIVVETPAGAGPLTVLRLDSDYDIGHIGLHDGIGVTDDEGHARLRFTLPDAGNMCVVLYRNKWHNDYFEPLPYTLRVETTPPDMRPDQVAGWHAPIVPRATNDGTPTSVPAPTSLVGWQPATWFNVAQENVGETDAPGPIASSIRIDGVELWNQPIMGTMDPGEHHVFNNLGVLTVPGGRHTLGLRSDALDDVYESDETNNSYAEQWVWSPQGIGWVPVAGMPQPAPRTGGWGDAPLAAAGSFWYNADGYRTPHVDPASSNIYWVAVAVNPGPSSDVDIRLHPEDDTMATAFTTSLAGSYWGEGQTDFVLINYYLSPPGAYDVGVLGVSGDDTYAYDAVYESPHGLAESSHGPFTLASNDLVRLHEFWFEPGIYTIELQDLSTTANVGFSLHGWQLPYQGKSDHVANGMSWLEPPGTYQTMRARVEQAGPYCIAVWKSGAEDGPLSFDYAIKFLSVTGTPALGQAAAGIVGVAPNPFNPRTEIRYQLDVDGEARLAIYNLRGQRVRTLVAGSLPAGEHRARWDGVDQAGRAVASGVYLVELQAGGAVDRRKITLVK